MRALLVVNAQPLLGDVLYLLVALEHVGVQHLVPIRAVEPLDVGVLVGLAWLDVIELDPFDCGRILQLWNVYFWGKLTNEIQKCFEAKFSSWINQVKRSPPKAV